MILLIVGVLLLLGWMAWEDARYRAISLWTFPALFGLLLLSNIHLSSWTQTLWKVNTNLLIVAVQLAGLWLYLMIKHKVVVHPMRGFLGWGDVLFWIAIVPAFSPWSFLLFYIGSALAALLLHTCLRQQQWYGDAHRVPLAGWQALVYSAWLLSYGFTDPVWLLLL